MKKTFRTAFLSKYPKYGKVLQYFEEANECPAEWENLTKPNLAKFVAFMGENLAATSCKTYCAMMKSVLNLYSEEVKLPKGFESILNPKKDASQQTWLTDKEINKLISSDPGCAKERYVMNMFLLGALTGARHSDYMDFTEENIVGDSLVYLSKKTHTESRIPLSPAVERILRENKLGGFDKFKMCDATFNNTLRRICKKCRINERVKLYQAGEFTEGPKWKYVSSHTARRSFATNLYLRGADLYTISLLMGHSDTKMTERYIVCGLKEMPENVLEYFNQFK